MNREIKCAYTELKNKFGTKEEIVFVEEVVHKEVVHVPTGIKMRKQSKAKPMFKQVGSSATTESLIELQKHFNLN